MSQESNSWKESCIKLLEKLSASSLCIKELFNESFLCTYSNQQTKNLSFSIIKSNLIRNKYSSLNDFLMDMNVFFISLLQDPSLDPYERIIILEVKHKYETKSKEYLASTYPPYWIETVSAFKTRLAQILRTPPESFEHYANIIKFPEIPFEFKPNPAQLSYLKDKLSKEQDPQRLYFIFTTLVEQNEILQNNQGNLSLDLNQLKTSTISILYIYYRQCDDLPIEIDSSPNNQDQNPLPVSS